MSQSTQTALALPGRKSHSSGDGTQTLRRRSQLQHYTNDVDGFLSAGLRSSSQSPDACTRWRGFERRIRRLRLCGLSNRTSCQGLSKIRPSLTARRLIAPLPNSVQCLRPALTRNRGRESQDGHIALSVTDSDRATAPKRAMRSAAVAARATAARQLSGKASTKNDRSLPSPQATCPAPRYGRR